LEEGFDGKTNQILESLGKAIAAAEAGAQETTNMIAR